MTNLKAYFIFSKILEKVIPVEIFEIQHGANVFYRDQEIGQIRRATIFATETKYSITILGETYFIQVPFRSNPNRSFRNNVLLQVDGVLRRFNFEPWWNNLA